ncbi:hypothetical protein GCM10023085_19870 [Actinomadura viridis]|uniref:AraC-like DNA-binding protein n=1 Tax=Actinomadura viridis TaxID=58110 RepID=A0A931GN87_9ACTN|nr:AraC family transcriptional regulator [Actinomadura viridis]MBG6089256.1 AraC-like DNA-binding protein [Actinomadura viridis]
MRPVSIEERGGWWLAQGRPHPALRPFLASYDGYWEDRSTPDRVRTLPGRHVVLILNLGPPLLVTVPGAAPARYASFVAGMHDGPGAYAHPGGQRGIQLDLTPLGAYTLLGTPMGALTNVAADLPDLLGPRAGELVERLAAAPGWAARFDLLDRFLLDRLTLGPSPAPEVERAWHLLASGGGCAPVAELAGEVGWSRRHLTQRFKEQIGLPPKVMARVLRFERALARMAAGGSGWADIAAGCGYYDQAHLNREFRALSGCTPSELLAAQAPEGLTTTAREFA